MKKDKYEFERKTNTYNLALIKLNGRLIKYSFLSIFCSFSTTKRCKEITKKIKLIQKEIKKIEKDPSILFK